MTARRHAWEPMPPVPRGHICEDQCGCGAWVNGGLCWKRRDDKVHTKEVHNGQSPASPARDERSETMASSEGGKP